MVGLYINNILVPTIEGANPVLNKKSYDVNNPSALWSDYSQTIEIPSTAEVDNLFGYLFNVNIDIQNTSQTNFNPDFNPNLKATARIDVNDIPIIEGYAQLTSIVIDDFNRVSYRINIYGTIQNMFNAIGNSKLTDLDFSALNHTWNRTNIEAGWTPTIGEGYCYPMIDYGLSQSYDLWDANRFFPAIFVKAYLDKIFTAAGFTYTSSFFESTLFKSLIVPYSAERLTLNDSDIADRIFFIERITSAMTGTVTTTPTQVSTFDTLIFNDDSTGDNFNTSGTDYNTGTGVWTNANTGTYSFRGEMTLDVTRITSSYISTDSPEGNNIAAKIAVVKFDGSTYSVLEMIRTEWDGFAAGGISPATTSSSHTFAFATAEHYIKSGEDIYLAFAGVEYYSRTLSKWNWITNFTFSISTGAKFTINLNPEIQIGQTMVMNNTIPSDVLQRDFLHSIFKLFNLFVTIDSDNPYNLIIEPYEDFFTGSDDLTEYLDTSKPFQIEPMAMLQGRRYEFSYKEDKDYANQKYTSQFNQRYGSMMKDIVNDFVTDTYNVTTIFSPTPLSSNKTNDRILSDIRFVDQNGTIKSGKSNIRILYWGGLIDTNKTWYLYETLPTTYAKTQYPYAGHLDHPVTPTFDLSFGVPLAVFYSVGYGADLVTEYTSSNLYNTYWRRYISVLTDKNSKIITCSMDLRHKYRDLSFQKTYYIRDAYYILLDVTGYRCGGNETTQCRFLKYDPVTLLATGQSTFRGGNKDFTTGDPLPAIFLDKQAGGSSVNPVLGISKGNGNTGGGGLIVGDNIKGSMSFKNVNNLGGSENIAGADDVTFIGTKGYYSYRNGETILNNISSWAKAEITLTGTEAAALFTTPIILLEACDVNEYYEVGKMLVYLEYNEAWSSTTPVLRVKTGTTGSVLNSISNVFSQVADAYLLGTVGTEALNMGESLKLETSADAGSGTTNSVKVVIYYRVNRV